MIGVDAEAHVELAHTAQLEDTALAEIRELLGAAFNNFNEEGWEHALGGMHVLLREDGRLLAHGAVVMRRLLHDGRTLRTGYVEAVAVRAAHRRQGLGGRVMEVIEQVIRGAYDLGALSASAAGAPLYAARGWRRWRGRTWALSPDGIVRTADDDDSVHVFDTSVPLDLGGELTCDWRDGELW